MILVADEDDQEYGAEVRKELAAAFDVTDSADDRLPLIVRRAGKEASKQFKRRLMQAARKQAPEWDELVQERARAIAGEILLKLLLQAINILLFTSCIVVAVLILFT